MQLTSRHELVYVTATLTYRETTIELPDVLVDTGAASTVINADLAADAGIFLAPNDQYAGYEASVVTSTYFMRQVDRFVVGDHGLDDFVIEIGEMDYGFEFGGIIGMDFLCAAGAVIDLGNLTIEFGSRSVERAGASSRA